MLIGRLVVDVGIPAPLEWSASLFPVGLDDPAPSPRYPTLGFGLHVLIAASAAAPSRPVAQGQRAVAAAVRNSEAWLAMRALLTGPPSPRPNGPPGLVGGPGVEAGPAPAQAPVPHRDDDFSQAESEAARFLQGLKTAR